MCDVCAFLCACRVFYVCREKGKAVISLFPFCTIKNVQFLLGFVSEVTLDWPEVILDCLCQLADWISLFS